MAWLLRPAAILTAVLFSVVIILMCISTAKADWAAEVGFTPW